MNYRSYLDESYDIIDWFKCCMSINSAVSRWLREELDYLLEKGVELKVDDILALDDYGCRILLKEKKELDRSKYSVLDFMAYLSKTEDNRDIQAEKLFRSTPDISFQACSRYFITLEGFIKLVVIRVCFSLNALRSSIDSD